MSSIKAHAEAIEAALKAADLRVHLVSVVTPKPEFPYVVLGPGEPREFSDALCDDLALLQFPLMVTIAGLTPASVWIVQQRTREVLRSGPSPEGWHLDPPTWRDGQGVRDDKSVTLDVDGRHPYFTVDVWDVQSQNIGH